MDESVLHHVLYKIANAPIRTYPYTHFYVEEVFPPAYYEELCAQFPEPNQFASISQSGKVHADTYQSRFVLPLKADRLNHLPFPQLLFWGQLSQALAHESWITVLFDKFHSDIRKRFAENYHRTPIYTQSELICDQSDYAIGPHTDHFRRVISLLFYLPPSSEQAHLGTCVYRPKDPYFTCPGTKHHNFEQFTKVFSAPFVPNSLFGFVRSDTSFHGVEPIGPQETGRRLLSHTLFWAHPDSVL